MRKRAKCEAPPTWGGVIPGNERFVPTFVDEEGVAHAYIDCQTGLVWEAVPSTDPFVWGEVPPNFPRSAQRHCINRIVPPTADPKGQKGWRLPSIAELASLVDTASSTCGAPDFKCLPDGSPFEIESAVYWSASELAGLPAFAWTVLFSDGLVGNLGEGNDARAWCVRGAMQESVY